MKERTPKLRTKTKIGNIGLSENSVSYKLEIDGVYAFTVDSISGLGIEVQVIEFTDGDNPLTFKRSGRHTYNNITVHNIPMTEEPLLYNWVQLVKNGGSAGTTKTVTIIMMGGATEIRRWVCFKCFPVSLNYHKMEPKKPLYVDVVIAVEKFEKA